MPISLLFHIHLPSVQLSTKYFSLKQNYFKQLTQVYLKTKPYITMVNGKPVSFVTNKIYCENKYKESQMIVVCRQPLPEEGLLSLLEKGN